MTTKTKNISIDFLYICIAALAVALSWFFHELAHWAAGTYLGYDMAMTFNTAYPLNGTYNNNTHAQLISAAGPIFTLIEAIVVFLVMRKSKVNALYAFLFTCFYMRIMAAGISFLNPNDEARISQSLGIGTFTLPLLMSAILFVLLYKTSTLYGFGNKFNIINLGLIILFSSVIILSDQFFKMRLI